MQWFKNLADSVNLPEFLEPSDAKLEPGIGSITFHHNLIVLPKDLAERYSNVALDNPEVRRKLMAAG
jgi:hypothetical protein